MTIVESKIVTVVDADVSRGKREMESFRVAQQKAITDTIKALEDQNKKLGDNAATWMKVGAAVAGVAAAAKFAQVSWKEYVDRANAQAATYGVSLEQLRKASAGLKTDTELLAFAEQQLSKDLGLTRKEMETVLRAQVALARNGRDAAKVEEVVGAALTKNTVKPLKEIGIILKQNEDPAKNFTQIMEALARAADDAGAAQAEVGENVQRAGVMIQNSWSDVKIAAGKLVDEGLAPLAGALKWVLDVANDFLSGGALTESDVSTLRRRSGIGTVGEALAEARGGRRDPNSLGVAWSTGQVMFAAREIAGSAKDLAAITARQEALRRGAKPPRGGGGGFTLDAITAPEITEWTMYESGRDRLRAGSAEARALGGEVDALLGSYGAFARGRTGGLGADVARAQQQTRLEQIFGPLEQFDAYATAWSTLEAASASALDAWITGSMSAAEAFKLAISEQLRALSIDMTIRSLREFATAAAMLANPLTAPLAAGHAKAGALYGAAAAAAAIGARALGGSGATGAGASQGGGAGASAAPVGSAPTTAAPTTVIIATGNDFSEDSPRARTHKARQLVRTAQAQAGRGGSFR